MNPPGHSRLSRHGLLLLHKKTGVTSFGSLAGVKRAFATGKAGHTGTLDKFASGLLLVLVGRGVKLAPLFSGCVKEYTGTIRFGEETDTLDPEGEAVASGPVPSLADIEGILPAFRGCIFQAPPAYSAVHIDGRRAHELAREGKEPEMKKRPAMIHSLEIRSWNPPEMEIYARVSAGTYIRSLARDIALAAGSRAYLSALKRTKVGPFSLENSVEDDETAESLEKALRPLDRGLFESLSLPCFFVDRGAAENFVHGRPLETVLPQAAGSVPNQSFAAVFSKSMPGGPELLLGIIEYKNGKWGYGHVFGGAD